MQPWQAQRVRDSYARGLGCNRVAMSLPPPSKPLKCRSEGCRSGRTGRSRKPLYARAYRGFESHSLRQARHSGHSFSPRSSGPKARRLRPFLANCPNHSDQRIGAFGAGFGLSWPVSLTQPNHGTFGTDVDVPIVQRIIGSKTSPYFELRSLRRSERWSSNLIWSTHGRARPARPRSHLFDLNCEASVDARATPAGLSKPNRGTRTATSPARRTFRPKKTECALNQ